MLPDQPSLIRGVRIEEVGPGRIPRATFAIRGRTVCYGDSGSGALLGSALLGVYSRIEGMACTLEESRNVFMTLGPHRALIEAAYAAAGETPQFVTEAAPQSSCDAGCKGTCDAGVCGAVVPASSPPATSGCSLSAGSASSRPFGASVALVLLALAATRRRRSFL
jgi:MYXO-CTERM domain-containing protein